jgi:hypothetical protein
MKKLLYLLNLVILICVLVTCEKMHNCNEVITTTTKDCVTTQTSHFQTDNPHCFVGSYTVYSDTAITEYTTTCK